MNHFLEKIFPTYSEELAANWNNASVDDRWALRELLSCFLPGVFDTWVAELAAEKQVALGMDKPYYVIEPEDFLTDPKYHLRKIYKEFDLKENQHFNDLAHFTTLFVDQQKYFNKQEELDNFVSGAITNELIYLESTTIIDEAYIQSRLKSLGYEIRCFNLNIFPLKSTDLNKLFN